MSYYEKYIATKQLYTEVCSEKKDLEQNILREFQNVIKGHRNDLNNLLDIINQILLNLNSFDTIKFINSNISIFNYNNEIKTLKNNLLEDFIKNSFKKLKKNVIKMIKIWEKMYLSLEKDQNIIRVLSDVFSEKTIETISSLYSNYASVYEQITKIDTQNKLNKESCNINSKPTDCKLFFDNNSIKPIQILPRLSLLLKELKKTCSPKYENQLLLIEKLNKLFNEKTPKSV